MDRSRRNAILFQLPRQAICPVLRPGKHQHLVPIALLDQMRQDRPFARTRHLVNRLRHRLRRRILENTTAETVAQAIYQVPRSRKRAVLSHLIKEGDWHQVLVFTRTKHGANRLARQLEQDGITSAAIHGSQPT